MMASWAGFMTIWTVRHATQPFGNATVTDARTATRWLPLIPALYRWIPACWRCCSVRLAALSVRPPRWLCWQAALTCCGVGYLPSTFRSLHLTVAAHYLPFPLSGDVSRVQWMLSQVLVWRGPMLGDLHGYRLRYQPGYPEGPDLSSVLLRSADGIHPLLRRNLPRAILLHSGS